MIVLDDFEFHIKNNELAISIDCPVAGISDLRWDTKNTIILSMEDGNRYVLTNVLPNVREILERIKTLMVIFKHNQNVVEAYEVEIVKDDSLGLEDSFNEEAISCYRKFAELKQG